MPVSEDFLLRLWQLQLNPTHRKGDPRYAFTGQGNNGKVFDRDILAFPRGLEIPGDLDGRADIYFTPHLFSHTSRRTTYGLPTRLLHSDLDYADPRELGDLEPQVWWETSPGKFQAVWILDRFVDPAKFRAVNANLNYYITDADHGGFSITKFLRVPGTLHKKDPANPHVVTLHRADWDDPGFRLGEVWRKVRGSYKGAQRKVDVKPQPVSKAMLLRLPAKLKKKLAMSMAEDRSKHVYNLVLDLLDAGFSDEETLSLAMKSPVAQERYAGRLEEQILTIMAKHTGEAEAKRAKQPTVTGYQEQVFRFEDYSRLMTRIITSPKWLIEGIWSAEAHGIIAGEEKTFKSLIALDLAVSVASGTKFLNYFEVPKANVGHVIFVQEENTEGFLKDRLEKICGSRGLLGAVSGWADSGTLNVTMPTNVPIKFLNNQSFHITDDFHMDQLEGEIQRTNAKLVVFDPLYLMMPGVDENSNQGMTELLGKLLRLKQKYGCGILVLHHYKKQDRQSPMFAEAARISGASAFGRWYESMLLIERTDEADTVRIVPKHRQHAPGEGLLVEFNMGPIGISEYEPIVSFPKDAAAQEFQAIKDVVKSTPGITVAELARAIGIGTQAMKRKLDHMPELRLDSQGERKSPRVSMKTA